MDKFIVIYQAECGEKEVFGIFNSFDDAYDWMKKDVDYNASLMYEAMMDYTCGENIDIINKIGNKKMEIEGYGIWEIFSINNVIYS